MKTYEVRIRGERAADDGWSVTIPGAGWDELQVGACPDCGGVWTWQEAGYVPGTRECRGCGSMFNAQPKGPVGFVQRERFYRP